MRRVGLHTWPPLFLISFFLRLLFHQQEIDHFDPVSRQIRHQQTVLPADPNPPRGGVHKLKPNTGDLVLNVVDLLLKIKVSS